MKRIGRTRYELHLEEYSEIIQAMCSQFGDHRRLEFSLKTFLTSCFNKSSPVFLASGDWIIDNHPEALTKMVAETKFGPVIDMIQTASYPYAVKACGGNIFHLSRELALALGDTDVPRNLSDIRLPYAAFYLDFEDSDVRGHHYSKPGKLIGAYVMMDDLGGVLQPSVMSIFIYDREYRTSSDGAWCTSAGAIAPFTICDGMWVGGEEDNYHGHDKKTYHAIMAIVLNAITYICSTNPEKTVIDALPKTGLPKKNKKKRRPCQLRYTVLGASYRYVRMGNSSGSRLGGVRKHLVRGHWRRQPYGPKVAPIYRPKWIEPHFRGKDISELLDKHVYAVE